MAQAARTTCSLEAATRHLQPFPPMSDAEAEEVLRELEGREMKPPQALVRPLAWLEPQAMHEPVLGVVDAADAWRLVSLMLWRLMLGCLVSLFPRRINGGYLFLLGPTTCVPF